MERKVNVIEDIDGKKTVFIHDIIFQGKRSVKWEDVEYDYPEFHLSMDCFWCGVINGDLVLKEHEAARWLTMAQLNDVEWLPADITIIEKIRKAFV